MKAMKKGPLAQRKSFFHNKGVVPVIGGKDVASKEAILRATGKLVPKKKKSVIVKTGIGAALVGAALSLVGVSIEKSKLSQLADAKERSSATEYTVRYSKITPEVASKEMREVSRLLNLNLSNKTDAKIADTIFEIARKSGVSPRIALRTIARSSGRADSLNERAALQSESVKEFERRGEFDRANQANYELQQTEKIQAILREQEKLDASTRDLLKKRVDKAGSFNVTR